MAFCSNCGADVSEQAIACPECGHPTGRRAAAGAGTGAAVAAAARTRTEPTAVASLVCGIAGFTLCPIICSILAIAFGQNARTKIRDDPTLDGEALARAGVILGWIGFAVFAIGFALWLLFAVTLIRH